MKAKRPLRKAMACKIEGRNVKRFGKLSYVLQIAAGRKTIGMGEYYIVSMGGVTGKITERKAPKLKGASR